MSKSIFITGAASGIGRATALLFAERGWFVGLFDMNLAGLEEVRLLCGGRSFARRLDVTDPEEFSAAVTDFERAAGRFDVLFNNAGISHAGWFEDVPQEASRKIVEVNLGGVINGVYAALEALKRTPGSRIVNMASGPAAVYGMPRIAAYSASKFGVRALSEALDLEFARHGIRVSVIMPAFVQTAMLDAPRHSAGVPKPPGEPRPAEDVARVVWDAVHGDKLHWYPMAHVRLLHRIAGMFPAFTRQLVKRRAKV